MAQRVTFLRRALCKHYAAPTRIARESRAIASTSRTNTETWRDRHHTLDIEILGGIASQANHSSGNVNPMLHPIWTRCHLCNSCCGPLWTLRTNYARAWTAGIACAKHRQHAAAPRPGQCQFRADDPHPRLELKQSGVTWQNIVASLTNQTRNALQVSDPITKPPLQKQQRVDWALPQNSTNQKARTYASSKSMHQIRTNPRFVLCLLSPANRCSELRRVGVGCSN